MTNSTGPADVEARLRAYIVGTSTRLPADERQLAGDYPLLESGVLDSLGLYSLIVHLENTFGVKLRDEDLLPQNFASLRAISQLVLERSDPSAR